jgi:hypothetical protein
MSSLVFMSIGIHRNAMADEGGGGLGAIRKQEAELRCISKIEKFMSPAAYTSSLSLSNSAEPA